MIVVVAEHIPDSIRGKMKLWFIELKPNVFITGVSCYLVQKIVNYLFSKSNLLSGMTIILSQKKTPGYKIISLGENKKGIIRMNGLDLVFNAIKDN